MRTSSRCPHPCGNRVRSVRPGSTCRRSPRGSVAARIQSSTAVPRRRIRACSMCTSSPSC